MGGFLQDLPSLVPVPSQPDNEQVIDPVLEAQRKNEEAALAEARMPDPLHLPPKMFEMIKGFCAEYEVEPELCAPAVLSAISYSVAGAFEAERIDVAGKYTFLNMFFLGLAAASAKKTTVMDALMRGPILTGFQAYKEGYSVLRARHDDYRKAIKRLEYSKPETPESKPERVLSPAIPNPFVSNYTPQALEVFGAKERVDCFLAVDDAGGMFNSSMFSDSQSEYASSFTSIWSGDLNKTIRISRESVNYSGRIATGCFYAQPSQVRNLFNGALETAEQGWLYRFLFFSSSKEKRNASFFRVADETKIPHLGWYRERIARFVVVNKQQSPDVDLGMRGILTKVNFTQGGREACAQRILDIRKLASNKDLYSLSALGRAEELVCRLSACLALFYCDKDPTQITQYDDIVDAPYVEAAYRLVLSSINTVAMQSGKLAETDKDSDARALLEFIKSYCERNNVRSVKWAALTQYGPNQLRKNRVRLLEAVNLLVDTQAVAGTPVVRMRDGKYSGGSFSPVN